MTVLVFTGPTLPAQDVEAAGFITLPPARQGDVYRAVKRHAPRMIGLIDGVFLDAPSVWHRELLWALSEGVHVFGAASMGALRAAELAPFGMRGVGRIFEAYRDGAWPGFDGPFEDDDEVAVAHAPAEAGFSPLSDAMVDLRDTLLALRDAGRIDAAACTEIATALRRLHFPDRSLARLAALAGIDDSERFRVARKRLDALAMLAAMQAALADDPPPYAPAFRLEPALVWQRFVAGEVASPSPEDALVLEELAIEPQAWRSVRRAALGIASERRAPDRLSVKRAFDRFRHEHGLWRAADLAAWQRDNGLDPAGFTRLIETAAAAEQEEVPVRAMLDLLRLEGRYAPLLARARAKLAAIGQTAADPLLDSLAQAWFADAFGEGTASPEAIRREYLYRQRLATAADAS